MPDSHTISDSILADIPHRRTRREVVVLKFGGTTVGSTPEQGRIRLARQTIADILARGRLVVPVFSAYRRGRSGSKKRFSVTDILQNYKRFVFSHDTPAEGVEAFTDKLTEAHMQLIHDLQLVDNLPLVQEIQDDIDVLKSSVAMSCSSYEEIPSLNDVILTAGERLAVKIMSAYLNRHHEAGTFPLRTTPVTALELGIYTDANFGSATIDWARAVDHAREVIVGQYLERDIVPIVTGFDGIYDPHNEFQEIMQSPREQYLDQKFARVHRTSLGRGGSDLTATFLGLALNAEYVGFCKETPGVLTGDDMLVGNAARTVEALDYDLATEAGNIYSRAVEPVRAGGVPVHIFDPAHPEVRTIVSNVVVPDGFYIIERPLEAVNIHAGTIPDEPGALTEFLSVFARHHVNVEEVRHQRSGTDCIVRGNEKEIQAVVKTLNERGLRARAHVTWHLRLIGNINEQLAARFNDFMNEFEPLTLAAYQIGTKVLTATVARNRAGAQLDEMQRIEQIVRRIHDELIVPSLEERSAVADEQPAAGSGVVRP